MKQYDANEVTAQKVLFDSKAAPAEQGQKGEKKKKLKISHGTCDEQRSLILFFGKKDNILRTTQRKQLFQDKSSHSTCQYSHKTKEK